jgi:DNA-binding SARP family transcriptional activator
MSCTASPARKRATVCPSSAAAHAAAGNTAEALLAYERCRRSIAEELGVDPSPATKLVYEGILRSV